MEESIPKLRKPPRYARRIPPHVAFMMIAVAFFAFDGAQVAFSLFAVAGGAFVYAQYGWAITAVDIAEDVADVAGTARTAGAAVTAGAAATGIGAPLSLGTAVWTAAAEGFRQIARGAARWLGGEVIDTAQRTAMTFVFLFKSVMSWTFMLLGYLTLWLWMMLRGVSIFAGSFLARRVTITFVAILIGLIPFIGDVPELTVWVTALIYLSWQEDKQHHDTLMQKWRRDMKAMQAARNNAERQPISAL
jgi:hypothetical protein